MSEFLAEARVLVRPDTTKFRAELTAQLAAIKVAPIVIPVVAGAAGGLASAAAATAALNAAQKTTEASTLGLASAAQVEASAFGKQAIVLAATTAQTEALAGVQAVAAKTTAGGTKALLGMGSAASRLDAALLGLRTALGSAAVIGLSATALGAIAAGKAIRGALAAFTQFQTELLTFRATTGATANEMIRVSEAALALGADITLPAVSAGDAAQAMTELAKAGLSTEDAIAGARGVLQLATAAQIDNAAASELAASALNAFGLSGDQAVRVADDLANASNAAQGSIADMGIALQQAAAVARQVGLSLEDTVSILTLLARNGLRGSDAGTSLRTALLRLVAPTKEASGLIHTLGINIRDAQGRIRPDVFAQFAEATAALSPAMRDAIAATVFGQDAIRAVAIAGREGADGLRLMQFEIDQEGTAAELAAARTSGLAGAFSALSSNLETVGVKLGDFVAGPLTAFVNSISAAVGGIDLLITGLDKLPLPVQLVDKKAAEDEGKSVGDVIKSGIGFALKTGITFGPVPGALGLAGFFKDAFTTDQAERIRAVTEELNRLQKARIALEESLPGAGDILTPQIKALRDSLRELRGAEVGPDLTPFQKRLRQLNLTLEQLRETRKDALERGADTSGFDQAINRVRDSIHRLRTDTENELGKIRSLSFEDLAKNLQLALRGFQLDPTGELAAGFLRDAKKITDKLRELGPNVSAATRAGLVEPLRRALQTAINAAVAAGELASADRLRKFGNDLMKALAEGITAGAQAFVIPAMGDSLQDMLAVAEATGAPTSATLARLRRRAELLQRDVDRLSAIPKAERTAVQQAKLVRKSQALNAVNAEIKRIVDEQEQQATEAAADAKRKAEDAADARRKAIEAMIKGFSGREQRRLNAVAAATLTETLRDDIAANKRLLRFYIAESKAIRERIRRTNLHGAALRVAREALAALNKDIFNTRLAIARDQARQQEAIRETAMEKLDLRIQLAEIRGNVKAQIKAHRAKLAAINAELRRLAKQHKKNTVEWLQLKVAQAEEQKAIKELRAQTRERNDAFKELAFEFLTMQQGFAANLFGNLIPTSFTGLVGTPSPGGGGGRAAAASAIPMGLRKAEGTEIGGPGTELGRETALARAGEGGMTRGQAMTEIEVLKSINRGIQQLLRGLGFREAQHQREKTAQSSGGGGVQVQ